MKEIITIQFKDIFLFEIIEKDKEEEKNVKFYQRYKINIWFPRRERNKNLEKICYKIYKKSKKQKKYIMDPNFIREAEFLLSEEKQKEYKKMRQEINQKLIEME